MLGVSKFIAKVRITGFIVNALRLRRAHIVRTPDNFKAVVESVHKYMSTRHRSQELNISRTSLH